MEKLVVVVVAMEEQVVCKIPLVMFFFVALSNDGAFNVLPRPLYVVSVDLSHRVQKSSDCG